MKKERVENDSLQSCDWLANGSENPRPRKYVIFSFLRQLLFLIETRFTN